ncbi:MAG TPA: GAF domain-containing protein [Thermodesulfobacteriota bacterium]|nr:GAF domain-containing protein [Thermodesulfobacteriota bacterium]HNU70805.1 GAF domain-containing protein [Thermodesulfobacteriota bacterium]HOC37748.1 GAF domain-containing protein [Thermodesulfobacteriota bacterium]HQO78106.1 GAF domain-containing protein [Thermodesulfobacteriota bacterium]
MKLRPLHFSLKRKIILSFLTLALVSGISGALASSTVVFLCLTGLTLVLTIAISFLLYRTITHPITILAQQAEFIAKGDFLELEPPSADEFRRLAEVYSALSRALKQRNEEFHAQTQELLRARNDLEKTNVLLLDHSRRLKRSLRELSVLFEATTKINSSLSLREILDSITDVLMKNFTTDTWSIRLMDPDGFLRIKSQKGLSQEFIDNSARRPTMDSYSGQCFLTNTIILVEDAEKAVKPVSTNIEVQEGIQSFGLVPIAVDNEVLGVLAGASKDTKGFFTEEHSQFMKALAQQLALAIRNARLYERVINFNEELEKEVVKRTEELSIKSQLLTQSEKLAALGVMADRVAHETRNPIVTIGGFARRLKKKLPPQDSLMRDIDIVINEVDRLEKMIFWITEFKRYISVDFEPTNINALLEQVLDSLAERRGNRAINVHKDLSSDILLVRADRKNLLFAFTNLLENRIESVADRGMLDVHTRTTDSGYVEVAVSDTGGGREPDSTTSMNGPYANSVRSESEMGLTIAHKIIKDHDGTLQVSSKQGSGTTFTVKLPILPSPETSLQRRIAALPS